MTTQVLNFLWLNLDFQEPDADARKKSIRRPMPAHYIRNIRKAGKRHAQVDIILWADSQRLTKRQWAYLEAALQTDRPNVHLKDLRDIPAYDQEDLYNQSEENPDWRDKEQTSLIWRQVDAAKALIVLQGDYKQTFFADLDYAHVNITSTEVQDMLTKHGLMVGNYDESDKFLCFENRLWGFDGRRREFFEEYAAKALKHAYLGRNGYATLVDKVTIEIQFGENVPREEICFCIAADGHDAEHPGHEFRGGKGQKASVSYITADQLADVFSQATTKRPGPPAKAVRKRSPVMG